MQNANFSKNLSSLKFDAVNLDSSEKIEFFKKIQLFFLRHTLVLFIIVKDFLTKFTWSDLSPIEPLKPTHSQSWSSMS
jgi:hypothetical protein